MRAQLASSDSDPLQFTFLFQSDILFNMDTVSSNLIRELKVKLLFFLQYFRRKVETGDRSIVV